MPLVILLTTMLVALAQAQESTCGDAKTLFQTTGSCCGQNETKILPPRMVVGEQLLEFNYGVATKSTPFNVTGPFGLYWKNIALQHNVLEVSKATIDACHAGLVNGKLPDSAMTELYGAEFTYWLDNDPDNPLAASAFLNANTVPKYPAVPLFNGVYKNNFCTSATAGEIRYFVCQVSQAMATAYAKAGVFDPTVNNYADAVGIVNTFPNFALDPTNSTTAVYQGIHCPQQHIAVRCTAA